MTNLMRVLMPLSARKPKDKKGLFVQDAVKKIIRVSMESWNKEGIEDEYRVYVISNLQQAAPQFRGSLPGARDQQRHRLLTPIVREVSSADERSSFGG